MMPTASYEVDIAPRPRSAAPPVSPARLALVAFVWGAIGFIHVRGASAAIVWAAVALAACLGLGILQLAGDDTRWTGMLAAVLLATSPLIQTTWDLPQGPAWDRVMLLKTMVIVCGLLLLARLGDGSGTPEDYPTV